MNLETGQPTFTDFGIVPNPVSRLVKLGALKGVVA
jgi:hypothetical protein